MDKLKQLREEAKKLLFDMRAINDKATTEKRAMSGEENEKYSQMEVDFDLKRAEITRLEKIEENTSFMNAAPKRAGIDPVSKGGDDDEAATYSRAFFDYVKGADFNKRDLTVGVNADGGFTVPIEYSNKVIEELQKNTLMRQLASTMQTSSTTMIPVSTTVPEFGWIDEKGAFPETDTKFDQIIINAFKFGGLIKISDELLQDSSIGIENHIMKKIAEGMGYHEEQAFIHGDGTKKPLGLASATVGVTTAGAGVIAADELIDLFHSLNPRYRTNAAWLISDDFEKAVRKLKDSTGQYMWQPGLTADKPATILGKAVYNSEFMDGMESEKIPAIFGDFKYYQIADRGTMSMQRLNELFAATGQVGFRVYKRLDGKLTLDSAVRTLKCA